MRLRSRRRCTQVARAVDTTDFRPSRNGGGSVPEAPHSVRQCWRALARCGACSRTLAFLDPLVARRNAWRAGQPEMWRCKVANRCTAVVRLGTACARAARGARCGAGSRTLGLSTPWCGMAWCIRTVGQRVAGRATREAATWTGAQLSSDSEQPMHTRRALRGRFSDSRISRPLGCGTA